MFLTATNLLCTLFTGSLTRKNIEKNFSSRLLASVKLPVNLGPRRHCFAPQLQPSTNSRINLLGCANKRRAACSAHRPPRPSPARTPAVYARSSQAPDLRRCIRSGNAARLESVHARDAEDVVLPPCRRSFSSHGCGAMAFGEISCRTTPC
jgi:hypothetical protein